MLVVAIGNPTRVPVNGLSVAVQYVDAQGQLRDFKRDFDGTLAAGQQVQVSTGLGPFQSADQFRVALHLGARGGTIARVSFRISSRARAEVADDVTGASKILVRSRQPLPG